MYEFRGIDVAGSNSHVKVSDAPVSICFTDHTSFVEVMEPTVNHPTEKFRLQMYDQLMALANTNVDLADIMGKVILFQVGFLNATSEIHFYFDNENGAGTSYLDTTWGSGKGLTSRPTKYGGVKKIKWMVLHFLLQVLPGIAGWAAGVQEPQDCDLPQCLEEIIGSTLTFQLNLPHFNFTAKHQSFTASCILDHNQRPPQRNFEVHGGNDNPEDNMPGGRGEASDPRDNSVDGSSTGEGAPVEEDWCSAEKTQNE
ncbi:hypothetical protein HID58_069349 [Brassica napus]|uniref:Uncharacterized protein n=1 Tax=Brassica napus TaxID=3708 RepID=A0ABQ7YVL8_BRANA|nr:hypothetical protein HID58_069349 [Brassica napus]